MSNLTPKITLRDRWILLIDDDPEILGTIGEGLKNAGFKVVLAAHVGEANAKLAQQRFDCIVTDLHLGRGDGGQVILDLRGSKGFNAKVPVILISGNLEKEALQRLAPLVHGVMVKPFRIPALVERIGALTLLVMPNQVLEPASRSA